MEYMSLKNAIDIWRIQVNDVLWPLQFTVNDDAESGRRCRASFMCFFVIPVPPGIAILENINAGLRAAWVDDVGWAMDVKRTTVPFLRVRTNLLRTYREMEGVDSALVCNDAFVSGVYFSDLALVGQSAGDLKPNVFEGRDILLAYVLNGDPDEIMIFEQIYVKLVKNANGFTRNHFGDIKALRVDVSAQGII
jgi:hypothetical protein